MKKKSLLIIAVATIILNTATMAQTCWQKVSTINDSYLRINPTGKGNWICSAADPNTGTVINAIYQSNNLISWNATTNAFPSQPHLAFNRDNNNRLFIATAHNGLYKSVNNGISWSYSNVGSGFGCGSLDIISDSINTLYLGVGGSCRGLHISSDNGLTWTNKIPGKDFSDIEVINSLNLVYACNTNNEIFYSVNNGNNWQQIVGQPFSSSVIMIKHLNNDVFVFSKNGNIYKTSNGGSTWLQYAKIPILNSASPYYNDLVFITPQIWCVGFNQNGLWKTTDSGVTWTQSDSCISGDFHYLFNEGSITIATTSEGIFMYKECNLTVQSQPLSQTINTNSNAQFIIGLSDSSATYQWQTDLGVGFQNLNNFGQYSGTTNDTLTVSNVTLSNNNRPFRCIINSGSCSDTSNVAVLTVNNNVGVNETSQDPLFSVFPNPAQSVINVKADSKLIGSVYSIYDNIGKVVLTGKLNSENTAIELGNLSGGIYMFSVRENMKQTFKVIKE
jgi:hypothetical protein